MVIILYNLPKTKWRTRKSLHDEVQFVWLAVLWSRSCWHLYPACVFQPSNHPTPFPPCLLRLVKEEGAEAGGQNSLPWPAKTAEGRAERCVAENPEDWLTAHPPSSTHLQGNSLSHLFARHSVREAWMKPTDRDDWKYVPLSASHLLLNAHFFFVNPHTLIPDIFLMDGGHSMLQAQLGSEQ